MAFFCPVRIRRNKKKHVHLESDLLSGTRHHQSLPPMGRITGSVSIETLVRVGIEKENGLSPNSKMIVLHDFTPCVDDELEVKRGQIINVLYQENDWVYVISADQRDRNGQPTEGFIPASYCAPLLETNIDNLLMNFKKKMPRSGPNSLVDCNFNEINANETNSNMLNNNNNDDQHHHQIDFLGTGNYCNQIVQTQTVHSNRSVIDIIDINNAIKQQQNYQENDQHFMTFQSSLNYQNHHNNGNHHNRYSPTQSHHSFPGIESVSQQQNNSIMNLDLVMATTTNTNTPSTNQTGPIAISMTSAGSNNSQKNGIKSNSNVSSNHNEHLQKRSYITSEDFDSLTNAKSNNHHQANHDQYSKALYLASSNLSNEHSINNVEIQPFFKDQSGRYVMLYTFVARDENDISVERGEIITVLNKDDQDWFWVMRSDSQEGFVPVSFTYPIDLLLNAHHVQTMTLANGHIHGQTQQICQTYRTHIVHD
ncbi:dachs ligand with SH3s [Dermatophagoides farinae]|uniref:Sh3 domain-containing protein n=1 Tax=Dermatophagoides farinae TaxID=6954 RepID=A0A9D4SKL5_DERFA|nr:GATA zinc finger domain-containing protein 14-like isoform X2 [Dermatophagoides farinae]KAH7644826.1 sh3 domain-containing protein [Dermatophagoides farinae]